MSYELEIAVVQFLNYIVHNVGVTDDWPCQISFDDDDEAEKFARLLQQMARALDE